MCSPVFDNKASVWFVGGRGNGFGASDNNGGCTKEWWDGQSDKAAAMAKLMTSNGGPIVSLTNVPYTGDDEDTIYSAGAFEDVEVGMVAFVIQDGAPDEDVDTGRYEITAVTDDEITLDGINGSDCELDINIGGAFEDLEIAIDETYAGTHSVTIYTNLNETVGSGITLTSGGDEVKNTFKRIIGYHTVPGDMSRGGAHYQSPLEILQNGSIDPTKTVLLDANDGAFELINIDADNIIIENLHLSNNDENTAAILFSNTPKNIVFRNCRFSNTKHVMVSAVDSVLFDSCLAMDLTWNHYSVRGTNNVILNCVSDVVAGANWLTVVSIDGTQVIGCLVLNGAQGIRVIGNTIVAMNNTFYDQTLYGINLDNAETGIVFNNIFALNPGAVGLRIAAAGSFFYNDYNCFIESDGTPLTVGSNGSGYEEPVAGPHSIEVDPDFVDAANGDFRVRNPLLLRGGRPRPDGRASVIGAIGQEYQFVQRARSMNAGRAGIIR